MAVKQPSIVFFTLVFIIAATSGAATASHSSGQIGNYLRDNTNHPAYVPPNLTDRRKGRAKRSRSYTPDNTNHPTFSAPNPDSLGSHYSVVLSPTDRVLQALDDFKRQTTDNPVWK